MQMEYQRAYRVYKAYKVDGNHFVLYKHPGLFGPLNIKKNWLNGWSLQLE